MEQELDYLNTEVELKKFQDSLFKATKELILNGKSPSFKGLLEKAMSEPVILTAIHKIKANKGSETPGTDEEITRTNILEKQYPEVIQRVQEGLRAYKPLPIRRHFIKKEGKKEKRPLGIPAIIDRIIQECIRMVIEPILEAQFFNHSYGFRPMRDAHQALERINYLIHRTGYHWVVEGDISKFFDTINHSKLINILWGMGIRDRRVLMIIKSMLKAGIMNESKINQLGAPQGGIISPLLANAYLHSMDKWITREWENKKLKKPPKHEMNKYRAMKDSSNLKPAYLVRYADDWILLTDSKTNALKWKNRIAKFLKTNLSIELSEEKTMITNVRKKAIQFLGYNIKAIKGKSRTGWITVSKPNPERLNRKLDEIHKKIKSIKRISKQTKPFVAHEINLINSQIRGIIQYYRHATLVNISLSKRAHAIRYAGYKALRKYGGFYTPAKNTHNLISVHPSYKTWIPAIRVDGKIIGLTSPHFVVWEKAKLKNPEETPFTNDGREMYFKRTGKKPALLRADELFSIKLSELIGKGLKEKLYNFEYMLNRAYAYNRDKGKCKVCKEDVFSDVEIHHIDPNLPLYLVNRVSNLATTHYKCHNMVHSEVDYSHLGKVIWNNILKFRSKL